MLLAFAAAIAAAVSIKVQGFSFGVNNNFFHIPIFENWDAEPAFAGDPFIHTLKYYVSGVWVLLRHLPLQGHTEAVFLVCHFVARWAALLVMGCMAVSLGIRRLFGVTALMFWLGLMPILQGSPLVGGGEMFPDSFTHTELTLALVLLCFLMGARGRWMWAFALTGILFDINIFVAVWTGSALVVVVFLLWRGGEDGKPLWIRCATGAAIAAAMASPVAYWTVVALTKQPAAPPFDYVMFLRAYYPEHFLIDTVRPANLLVFAAVVLSSSVTFRLLGEHMPVWRSAFWGLGGVLVAGVFLPLLSHNSTLLNLHLLRVGAVIIVLATLLPAIVAAGKLAGGGNNRLAGAGALLLLSLPNLGGIIFADILLMASCKEQWSRAERLWLGISCLIAFEIGLVQIFTLNQWQWLAEGMFTAAFLIARPYLAKRRPRIAVLAGSLAAVLVAFTVYKTTQPVSDNAIAERVKEAAEWARQHTDPRGVFLVPVRMEPDFGLLAKRRFWANWKEGAAVMWAPSFYWTWWPRLNEVKSLHSLSSKVSYACGHKLDYIVAEQTGERPDPANLLFENSQVMILRVPAECRRLTFP